MGAVAPVPAPAARAAFRPAAKLTALDAVRGAAAFVVFNQHVLEGLLPRGASALAGTPLEGCENGPAAVVLFFVLSGFVLTLAPLAGTRPNCVLPLVAKRWPRLAGTVLAASLAYMAVAEIGGFPPAGLAPQMAGPTPPLLFWGQALDVTRAYPAMAAEALFGTFFAGAATYNPVLWTMRPELVGSMIAFGLAAVALLAAPRWLRVCLAVAGAAAAAAWTPWLAPFPLGVALAVLHRRVGGAIRLSGAVAALLCWLAAVLWSWDLRTSLGWWSWANSLGFDTRVLLWMLAQSAAAVCWLAVALYCRPVQRALSSHVGHMLGRLSFPLYLVHFLAIASAGAWLAVALSPFPLRPAAAVIVYGGALVATLALAAPLALFDIWWTRSLSRAVRAVAAWRSGVVAAGRSQELDHLPRRVARE